MKRNKTGDGAVSNSHTHSLLLMNQITIGNCFDTVIKHAERVVEIASQRKQ